MLLAKIRAGCAGSWGPEVSHQPAFLGPSCEPCTHVPGVQAYLLFGDESFLAMFAEAYAAAMGAMRLVGEYGKKGWLVDIHMDTGRLSRIWISSLAAFWPGMQALIGVRCKHAEGSAEMPEMPATVCSHHVAASRQVSMWAPGCWQHLIHRAA